MKALGKVLVQVSVLAVIVGLACDAYAGPKGPKLTTSMSPDDYSNYRYHNQLNSDFSGSDRFDLNNPIEVEITIHGLHLNDDGYVELFFSYPGDSEVRLPKGMAPDTPIASFRRATLQTADGFKQLKVGEREFKKGISAIVSGWPALPVQEAYSEMLVDEIQLGRNGKRYVFHADSEKMVKFKDKDLPREKSTSDGQEPPKDSGD